MDSTTPAIRNAIPVLRDRHIYELRAQRSTLHPLRPALLTHHSDVNDADRLDLNDVPDRLQRLYVLIAVRPAGRSSTSTKHLKAIAAWLSDMAWPDAVMGKAYLAYDIELPNDNTSTPMVRAILDVLTLLVNGSAVLVDRGWFLARRMTRDVIRRTDVNLPDLHPQRTAWLLVRPDGVAQHIQIGTGAGGVLVRETT
jgi:hypothetical protein